MAAILSLTTGVVYVRGWTGTLSGGTVVLADGTAAAPAIAFTGQPGLGLWRAASGVLAFTDGAAGNGGAWVAASGFVVSSTRAFQWTSSGDANGSIDTQLVRVAAGIISPAAGNSFGLASLLLARTAPTVTSAGTSPSITGSNGSASFRVNVGTGGTATTIVLAMPAATTGWNATAVNLTGAAANRAGGIMVQQSSTTTSITLQYQTQATGVALAFTASDIVGVTAFAY